MPERGILWVDGACVQAAPPQAGGAAESPGLLPESGTLPRGPGRGRAEVVHCAPSTLNTQVVPGVAMALGFAQLEAAALPCKMAFASEYNAAELASQKEELLVSTGLGVGHSAAAAEDGRVDWAAIDPRIMRAQEVLPCLHVLSVPTWKGLTDVLRSLAARCGPAVRVLRCSGNTELQVRLKVGTRRLPLTEARRALGALRGCVVKFDYALPTSRSPGEAHVACEVQLPEVLSVIRAVDALDGAEVAQCYDFWG